MTSPRSLLSLLAQRAPILHHITDGSVTKRALDVELSVSRSTIDRALASLETAQLVHKVGGAYELTAYGRIVYREYSRISNRYETLTQIQPLLQQLPAETRIDGAVFEDTTVITADISNPSKPQTRFEDRIRHSEALIGVVPIAGQSYIDFYLDQCLTQGLQLALLLDGTVVEQLWQKYPDTLHTALQADHCALLSSKQTPPFMLALVDWREVWLGIYDDRAHMIGILYTEAAAAIHWAKRRLQQYGEQGTPLHLRGDPSNGEPIRLLDHFETQR